MPQNFIKFYGNDWRSDPRLRMCSAAARGVWIDLITFMMEAEPFGYLLINGKQPTAEQIGMLTCTPPTVVKKALTELEDAGVFSRDDNGVIYSRRMLRDAQRSEEGRRWKQAALAQREEREPFSNTESPPISPPSRGPSPPTFDSEARSQKPEAKNQKEVFAFEGRVVRLTESDFRRWQRSYPHVADSMTGLLESRDVWLAEQPETARKSWFMSTSAWLSKRNTEAAERAKKPGERKPNAPAAGTPEWEQMMRDAGAM